MDGWGQIARTFTVGHEGLAWWACGEHLKPERRYSPEDMQICTMKLLIYCGGHTWGKLWVHLRLHLSRGDGKNLFDFCINGFNRLLNRIKFKSNKSQCVHILSVYKRFRGAQLGVILLKDIVHFWKAHTHTMSGGGSGNCSLLIASWTGRAKVTVHLEAPDEAYRSLLTGRHYNLQWSHQLRTPFSVKAAQELAKDKASCFFYLKHLSNKFKLKLPTCSSKTEIFFINTSSFQTGILLNLW